MNTTRLLATLVAIGLGNLFPNIVRSDHIWINEFHYDNIGDDDNEFVEIAFRSGTATSINDYTLNLYNGVASRRSVDESYNLATAAMFGSTIAIAGDPMNRSISFFTVNTPGIQNGSPDGLVLSLTADGSQVGPFLSYEGGFTAVSGPALGVTSTDIGVEETGTTLATHSLYLTGSGIAAADFTWSGPDSATPGLANLGQTFAVPEPVNLALLGLGSLCIVGRRRRSA